MHRNNLHSQPALEIIEVIASTSDRSLLHSFFSEIFSEAELKDISLRWELLKKLRQGLPQRQIAAELGISLCKITRGAKIIKDSSSATNKILSQIS